MDFTLDEIELLLKACDAMKSDAGSKMLIGAMLSTMLSKDSEAASAAMDKRISEYDQKEEERKVLEDRITCVKAKLINARINGLTRQTQNI